MLNNRALLEDNRRQVEVWIFRLTSLKWKNKFVNHLSENRTKPNVQDIKCVYKIYISECVCCSALSTGDDLNTCIMLNIMVQISSQQGAKSRL